MEWQRFTHILQRRVTEWFTIVNLSISSAYFFPCFKYNSFLFIQMLLLDSNTHICVGVAYIKYTVSITHIVLQAWNWRIFSCSKSSKWERNISRRAYVCTDDEVIASVHTHTDHKRSETHSARKYNKKRKKPRRAKKNLFVCVIRIACSPCSVGEQRNIRIKVK